MHFTVSLSGPNLIDPLKGRVCIQFSVKQRDKSG